jgi:hypothetical protein
VRESFFVVCLIRSLENCGIAAMIRTFQLRCGGYEGFRIVAANKRPPIGRSQIRDESAWPRPGRLGRLVGAARAHVVSRAAW